MSPIRRLVARLFACGLIVTVLTYGEVQRNTIIPSPRMAMVDARMSPISPASVVHRVPRTRVVRPSDAVLCMAQVLFFEGFREPEEGLEAIAATVFNRMATKGYPKSVCGVVYQPYQYSWTLDTRTWTKRPPKEYVEKARAFLAQRDILSVMYPVTHFHRHDIRPDWASTLIYRGTYGLHKFYGRD